MNTHHITRLLSVGLVLAALALGAALSWPIWVWFLLPALIAGALLIDMNVSRAEAMRSEELDREEAVPEPAEPSYMETSVVVVPVQSAVEDCPFLFSGSVWWCPAEGLTPASHGNPAALAATSVLQRVQRVTLAENPSRCTFVAHLLESLLGTPLLDDSGLVVAFATDIRLILKPKDQEHLEELDGLRKAMGSWESRRQHERNLREYLGEDVLQSPGSAVVWWMARHDDEIERAVEMIAPLTVLSAAANDEEIPEEYRDLFRAGATPAGEDPMGGFDHPGQIGDEAPESHGPNHSATGHEPPPSDHLSGLLDDMGFPEGAAETAVFLDRLARMSDAAGRPDAAEDIRRHMRRETHESGRSPADLFEGGEADGPVADASTAYPPPPSAGDTADHRSSGAEPLRPGTSGWQVTPEGLVSEADAPDRRFDPEAWAHDGSGPERQGGEL